MAMLVVDLRELGRGPVETSGTLDAGHSALAGLDFELTGPLEVAGRIQQTGPDDYYWRGHLSGAVRQQCGRCLTDLDQRVEADIDAYFTNDPDAADEPQRYPLPDTGSSLDLAPVVREELILTVPLFPLCRDDCAGLCPDCGADLNRGSCECARTVEPS
jgi:uncharacterized protein